MKDRPVSKKYVMYSISKATIDKVLDILNLHSTIAEDGDEYNDDEVIEVMNELRREVEEQEKET